jgi:alpha-beta hydrolase superfamily lysophospholipase
LISHLPKNIAMKRTMRISWRILAAIAALTVLGMVWLLRPLGFGDLDAKSDPARSYDEAMERWEQKQAREAKQPLHEGGRTIVLSHGYQTDRVFVLLHGLTNAPRQFRELGEKLFATGANVVIPRLAHHGLADRMTEAHAALTAHDLIDYAQYGVDLAQGLGRNVTVVGLSVSGVSAAWLAQNRDDIDEAFLLAPLFGPAVVPDPLTPAITAALVRWPNKMIWWDPRVRENLPGPPYNYPRFPTRALGEALRLGLQTAQPERTLRVNRLGVILTENDPAVNNARTRRLVEQWRAASPETGIFLHEFPAAENIPHDFIDPLQPDARTDKVNALLVEWLTQSR